MLKLTQDITRVNTTQVNSLKIQFDLKVDPIRKCKSRF